MNKQEKITNMYLNSENNDITEYLTIKECASLKWNMNKINKAISDKKLLNKVFKEVASEGFISCKELKDRFSKAFIKYGISLTPKASLIERYYKYKAVQKCCRINGIVIKGYELTELSF